MIKKYNVVGRPFAFTVFDNVEQEHRQLAAQKGDGVTLNTESGAVDIYVGNKVFPSLNYPQSVYNAVEQGILEEFIRE